VARFPVSAELCSGMNSVTAPASTVEPRTGCRTPDSRWPASAPALPLSQTEQARDRALESPLPWPGHAAEPRVPAGAFEASSALVIASAVGLPVPRMRGEPVGVGFTGRSHESC